MPKENKTQFIILGFLLNSSLSGYEVGKMIKQSTSYFWQESDASIYPTLKLLTREGLVTKEIVYVGKRKKEVFTISDAGREAFAQWFTRAPDQDLYRRELLLKYFFTSKTEKAKMQHHLNRRLQELTELQNKYLETELQLQKMVPSNGYWLKSVQLGIAHIGVDIQWLNERLIED